MATDTEIAPVTNPVGNGLINNPTVSTSTLPPPQPVPPIASYTPVAATPGVATPKPYVVPQSGLVQEQVKKIVAEDSPLMQQSRMLATQTMAERGLVNSSLNTTAGQQAVIAAALPIAQADAAAYNAAMTNTANAENAAESLNAQLISTMNLNNANAKNTALSATAQAENVRSLALIDNNTKQALALLDTQNRQLLQTNANAAQMFQETVKNIAAISVNDTMTRAAKDAAVSTQINLLNQGLQTIGGIAGTVPAAISELNLSQYFLPTGGPSTFTPEQRVAQIGILDRQISELEARRNRVATTGEGVPILTGPNASERRVPLWEAAIAELDAQLNALRAERASFSAQGGTA